MLNEEQGKISNCYLAGACGEVLEGKRNLFSLRSEAEIKFCIFSRGHERTCVYMDWVPESAVSVQRMLATDADGRCALARHRTKDMNYLCSIYII